MKRMSAAPVTGHAVKRECPATGASSCLLRVDLDDGAVGNEVARSNATDRAVGPGLPEADQTTSLKRSGHLRC